MGIKLLQCSTEGREMTFGSSYREVWKNEDLRNLIGITLYPLINRSNELNIKKNTH